VGRRRDCGIEADEVRPCVETALSVARLFER